MAIEHDRLREAFERNGYDLDLIEVLLMGNTLSRVCSYLHVNSDPRSLLIVDVFTDSYCGALGFNPTTAGRIRGFALVNDCDRPMRTLGNLADCTANFLLHGTSGLGKKCLELIIAVLAEYHLELKEPESH